MGRQRSNSFLQIMPGSPARTGPFKITVPKELVGKYGFTKFQENIKNTKRIAGVFSCHYEPDLEWCMVEALDDLCDTVYQNLELIQTRIRLQPKSVNLFRKSGSLKSVMDISRCSVHLDEKSDSLLLIGLLSEVNAAKLLLDEHTAELKVTQPGKKPKPKKKNDGNKNEAPTRSTCNDASSLPAATEILLDDKMKAFREDDKTSNVSYTTGKMEYSNSVRTDVVVATSSAGESGVRDDVQNLVPQPGNTDINQEIQSPLTEEEPIMDCVVCLIERPTVAFVPCGHRHTCPACAKKVFESDNRCCPTCREEIKCCMRIWT